MNNPKIKVEIPIKVESGNKPHNYAPNKIERLRRIAFVIANYFNLGSDGCASALGIKERAVLCLASRLKVKANPYSLKRILGNKRSAEKHRGKKRPDQSDVIKRSWREGKLKPHPKKSPPIIICPICNKQFARQYWGKKLCSKKCHIISRQIQWQRFPHPKGMKGKHHTAEAKEKWASKLRGRIMPQEQKLRMMKTRERNGTMCRSRTNASWKAGRACDLKNIFFRSSWERNYARYLDFLIRTEKKMSFWEYEAETFWFDKIKRGIVSFRPDFKVHFMNGNIEYHEVKGWMDAKSITKIKRMKKYHPNIKLIIIDANRYKGIAQTVKHIIPFWE